jgi:CRISPR-associated exonuclease Cas4
LDEHKNLSQNNHPRANKNAYQETTFPNHSYYLKHEKGIQATGMIDYPKQHRTLEVILTLELEEEVETILKGIQAVRSMASPPVVAEPMAICKKCAYQDLCWG